MRDSNTLPKRILCFAVTGALLAGTPGCPGGTGMRTNPNGIPGKPPPSKKTTPPQGSPTPSTSPTPPG
ncbi:MAG: hypothetical protein JKY65_32960 [Planctomycetes bacterium]|nr:hypothetical protein [Planctomycetota bacterium]